MCKITKIFFAYKKLQYKRISDSISTCLRKFKYDLTASDCLNNDFINKLIAEDRGYQFLECERSSPVFWEKMKKNQMAMVRQTGKTTFFITLTANELEWTYLLISLMKTVKNVEINEDQANNLSYLEKRELIGLDPVTCARYFDYRIHKLLNIFKKTNCIFDEYHVVDYYYRIEFQLKGKYSY